MEVSRGELLFPDEPSLVRWQLARVVVAEEGELEVREVIARCARIEGGELFRFEIDGVFVRCEGVLERDASRAWKPILTALLERAAREGAIGDVTMMEAHPEPGELPWRTTFDGVGLRVEEVEWGFDEAPFQLLLAERRAHKRPREHLPHDEAGLERVVADPSADWLVTLRWWPFGTSIDAVRRRHALDLRRQRAVQALAALRAR